MGKRLQNLTELLGVVVVLQAAAPQAPTPEQLQAGQRVFAAQCGFCHGRDAMGGETGPNLTRSPLVRDLGIHPDDVCVIERRDEPEVCAGRRHVDVAARLVRLGLEREPEPVLAVE